jgi:hypothetical protein
MLIGAVALEKVALERRVLWRLRTFKLLATL